MDRALWTEKLRNKNWSHRRKFRLSFNVVCLVWSLQSLKSEHAYVEVRVTQTCISVVLFIYIYRVSQEECARLREGVPYVKLYRYNPKHLCPKLNGYGDIGQRKVWSSGGSTHCTCQLEVFSTLRRWVLYHITAIQLAPALNCICTSFRVMTCQSCYVIAGHSCHV